MFLKYVTDVLGALFFFYQQLVSRDEVLAYRGLLFVLRIAECFDLLVYGG